jgi:hypothetical protein
VKETKTNVVEIPRTGPAIEVVDNAIIMRDKRELWGAARYSATKFRETGNPVYAIESFLRARLAGKVPPKRVLAWIEKCFTEWHDVHQGKKSLDSIMGLDKGRGNRLSAFERILLEERDYRLLSDVSRLVCLGATVEKAAGMVARKLEESKNRDRSRWTIRTLSADTIAQRYLRWPKRKNEERFMKDIILRGWTDDDERAYLKSFPADCLEPVDSLPLPWRRLLKLTR